jgi:hypothetical protein
MMYIQKYRRILLLVWLCVQSFCSSASSFDIPIPDEEIVDASVSFASNLQQTLYENPKLAVATAVVVAFVAAGNKVLCAYGTHVCDNIADAAASKQQKMSWPVRQTFEAVRGVCRYIHDTKRYWLASGLCFGGGYLFAWKTAGTCLATLIAAWGHMNRGFNAVQEKLDDLDGKVDNLSGQLEAGEKETRRDLSDKIIDSEKKVIGEVEKKIKTVITAVDAKTRALSCQMVSVKKQIDASTVSMNDKIDGVDNKVEHLTQLYDQLSPIAQQVSELLANVKTLDQKSDERDKLIMKIKSTTDQFAGLKEDFNKALEEQKDNMSQLKNQLQQASVTSDAKIGTLLNDAADNSKKLQALEKQNTQIISMLESLREAASFKT